MKAVLQRVSEADVEINDTVQGSIQRGYLILLGIEDSDSESDIDWLVRKIISMRIFNDAAGKMNLSIDEADGSMLVISQFTLHASTKKGNRPSFIKAAKPDIAIPLYESFITKLKSNSIKVETGIFGANMKVSLINNGPVTILLDSKNKV